MSNNLELMVRGNKLVRKNNQTLEVRFYLVSKSQPDLVDTATGSPVDETSVFVCSFAENSKTGYFSELLYHEDDYRLNNALHNLTNFVRNKFLNILKPQQAIRSKIWREKKALRDAAKLAAQEEINKLKNDVALGDKINTNSLNGDY